MGLCLKALFHFPFKVLEAAPALTTNAIVA
jgi:hypothetical protein